MAKVTTEASCSSLQSCLRKTTQIFLLSFTYSVSCNQHLQKCKCFTISFNLSVIEGKKNILQSESLESAETGSQQLPTAQTTYYVCFRSKN